MKDFRGIDLHIGDTVAIIASAGDFGGLKLGSVIGFGEQFGKEVCVVKYNPGEGYSPLSTLKRSLTSAKIAKL